MIRSSDAVILLAGIAGVLAFAAVAPVRAQECLAVPDAVAAAESVDGGLIDLVPVDGSVIDHVLLVEGGNGLIQLWGVAEGCVLGPMIPLDTVKDRGQPV
ncbi:hypothetical protein PRN20_18305 [Devosia sp. ZB163]|uniref:hypothetical protein n=1 Tax=Devosia sp. ZB163 TaxID=3025938 RepID=UPI002362E5ED|nr:hypothetical protein [Devosia sp. ZB163]MDC9825691.1 hypothetical protein [Devosia sp. ZB163]